MPSWIPTKPVPQRRAARYLIGWLSQLGWAALVFGVALVVDVILSYQDGTVAGRPGDESLTIGAVVGGSMAVAAVLFTLSAALRLAAEAADNLHRLTDVAVSFDQERRRAAPPTTPRAAHDS